MNDPETVWPPAPKRVVEEAKAAPIRFYLTNARWLDVVCGVAIGFVIGGGVSFAVGQFTSNYFIPRRSEIWWATIVGSSGLLACLVVWVRLRLFYRVFANSILWGGGIIVFALMGLLFRLFWLMLWTD